MLISLRKYFYFYTDREKALMVTVTSIFQTCSKFILEELQKTAQQKSAQEIHYKIGLICVTVAFGSTIS